MSVEGVVERHYLLCPVCGERMDLNTFACSGCGSTPTVILWESSSPELVAVARTDNAGRGRRWLR